MKINAECVGRTAAYTVYNLGIMILVGLARTIIAIYHLALHTFRKARIEFLSDLLKEEVESEECEEIMSKAEKLFARMAKREDKWIAKWDKELNRGLAELVIVGGAYYTYQDHFSGKNVSALGLGELISLINKEKTSDQKMQQMPFPFGNFYSSGCFPLDYKPPLHEKSKTAEAK